MKRIFSYAGATIIAILYILMLIQFAKSAHLGQAKNDPTIKQLQREIVHQNNSNYVLQQSVADLQFQKDQLERFTYEYASGRITQEEYAAKVESIEPRSFLLEIKKHRLEWDQ